MQLIAMLSYSLPFMQCMDQDCNRRSVIEILGTFLAGTGFGYMLFRQTHGQSFHDAIVHGVVAARSHV